jgi:cell division septation protein DedD
LAHTTQDDAFHEIQLNGKQLIFLFMAATIVSVVIFLVGVMVGRGVRSERSAVALNDALSASPAADVQPTPAATPLPPSATAADLSIVPPPPTADEMSEIRPGANAGDQKPAGQADAPKTEKPAAAPREPKPLTSAQAAAVAAPAPAAAAVRPEPAPVKPSTKASEPFVVQVAAVSARRDADEYAKGLASKGYNAYVEAPQPGRSASYRVRVGGFKTHAEAQTMAEKIGKEMKMKTTPWVTNR